MLIQYRRNRPRPGYLSYKLCPRQPFAPHGRSQSSTLVFTYNIVLECTGLRRRRFDSVVASEAYLLPGSNTLPNRPRWPAAARTRLFRRLTESKGVHRRLLCHFFWQLSKESCLGMMTWRCSRSMMIRNALVIFCSLDVFLAPMGVLSALSLQPSACAAKYRLSERARCGVCCTWTVCAKKSSSEARWNFSVW